MVLLKLVKINATLNGFSQLILENTLKLKVCLIFRCLSRLLYKMAFPSLEKRQISKIKTAQGVTYNSTTAQALSSSLLVHN